MYCPLCDAAMREVERKGVKIDICPECKGVWLDRGELDRLLRAVDEEDVEYHREREKWPDSEWHHKKRKRRGILGELFEMFD